MKKTQKLTHIDTHGVSACSDRELLALFTGDKFASKFASIGIGNLSKLGVNGLADSIVGDADYTEAMDKEFQLALAAATRVLAAVELGRRVASVTLDRKTSIRSSRDVIAMFRPLLEREANESFVVVLLDARNRPIATRTIATGDVNLCAVSHRSIFEFAIRESATAVILLHNHPSGSSSPSPLDLKFTKEAVAAGDLLNIHVLDHMIIGLADTFSFLDAGLIGPKQ